MKIIIFGASGMLGNSLARHFASKGYQIILVSRTDILNIPTSKSIKKIILKNFLDLNNLEVVLKENADYVINCAGIIKQNNISDINEIFQLNSYLPKILDLFSNRYNYKLIQFSTDCVFSGSKGNYTEKDLPDASDTYGLSKYLGESAANNTIVIRTSIIGHGVLPNKSLIDWFLSCKDSIKGFSEAIFSGFPTIILAQIIDEYIFNNKNLKGLYHLSNFPISKYDLLNKVSKYYQHNIPIIKNSNYRIDRTLDSEKFTKETGFKKIDWDLCIQSMYDDYMLLRQN